MNRYVEIFLILPAVGAFIGYATKSIAVQMIFRPARFVGVGPIGWQGVIQRRASVFAAGIADALTEGSVDVTDLFDRVDAHQLLPILRGAVDVGAPELAAGLVNAMEPGAWDALLPADQAVVIERLRRDADDQLLAVVEDVRGDIVELLDVRGLVIELLSGENADRLARLARRIGEKELRFLIWYGAILGFFIGLIEAIAYIGYSRIWLLPIVGAIDGCVNNWLVIQMLFRPLERTVYFGFLPYQGLFPARQAQVAKDYAGILAEEVLTIDNLMARVFEPARLEALLAAIGTSLEVRAAGYADGLARADEFVALRSPTATVDAGTSMVQVLLPVMPDVITHLENGLDLGAELEGRLANMPKEEFESVLHGIFEADEKMLVVLGVFIGAGIGTLQAGVMVAFGLT